MSATVLCIASYEKGAAFLSECRSLDCPVILVTVEKLKDADWPRAALDEMHWLPDFEDRQRVLHGVSWMARTRDIARVVALDEFDLELAAFLREHLRLPGMGETAVRFVRDKLAMREKAAAAGVPVPPFTGAFNDDGVASFVSRVPPPWVLKPRTEAASIGIRRIEQPGQLGAVLEELGDRRSHFLLEAYVKGPVFHVDSVVAGGVVRFAAASRYASPPLDVVHAGGLFCSAIVERGSADERALLESSKAVTAALGIERGALHTEFIRSEADGTFTFLETAARVGGANIVEMVEAATGVNLWREWARVEVADLRREPYAAPEPRTDYAGILISLSRQERPDTSAYDDPEVVWRLNRRHHAGLIVASPDRTRVMALLDSYMARFRDEFLATLPAPDKPTA
jgi:biotin carboxylase